MRRLGHLDPELNTGEVLPSSTVGELVADSAIGFADLGERQLQGVPGSWRLYRVRP